MLRKILEILGLVESRRVAVHFVGQRSCETLDSLVVIETLRETLRQTPRETLRQTLRARL